MGAVVPSSARLSAVLASIVPTAGAPVVVELGPGTGAVSAVIDERLPPGARHLAVELDAGMVEFLGRTRPGLEVVHGDARDLGKLLAERGVMHVDAVVCGLPWALFDEPTQRGCSPRSGTRSARPGRSPPSPTCRAGAARRAPVPPHAARAVRGGRRHRAGVAQHAARVRLRVPRPDRVTAASRVPAREIVRLAGPALPVLAAEPLYLLVDTAVVGRLGAVPLAGLAVGRRAVRAGHRPAQLPVLRHDRPRRPAARLRAASGRRRRGRAGHVARARRRAARLGVGQLVAGPVAEALGDGGAIADGAVTWLRVALFGAPLLLVTLAGNGWMRGVQDTARPLRYVLAGNGVSAVRARCSCTAARGVPRPRARRLGVGERARARASGAGCSVGALVRRGARSAAARAGGAARAARHGPRPGGAQPRLPGVLPVRGRGRRPVRRAGGGRPPGRAAAVGLHGAGARRVAIAAQSLVGAALGAGDGRRARALAAQVTRYGLVLGVAFGVLFAALAGVLPPVFTPDAAVLAAVPVAWWFFVALQPRRGRRVRHRRGAARRGRRRVPAQVDAGRAPSSGSCR